MMGLSPVQILIVLLIAVVLFGADRVPEAARGLGRSLREFRGALTDDPVPLAEAPAPRAEDRDACDTQIR